MEARRGIQLLLLPLAESIVERATAHLMPEAPRKLSIGDGTLVGSVEFELLLADFRKLGDKEEDGEDETETAEVGVEETHQFLDHSGCR